MAVAGAITAAGTMADGVTVMAGIMAAGAALAV
jgi:hypothetical protein